MQFPDSKNAQHNLMIAQTPQTYIEHDHVISLSSYEIQYCSHTNTGIWGVASAYTSTVNSHKVASGQ